MRDAVETGFDRSLLSDMLRPPILVVKIASAGMRTHIFLAEWCVGMGSKVVWEQEAGKYAKLVFLDLSTVYTTPSDFPL